MYCYIYLLLGANYQNKKSDNLTKTETQIVLAVVYCISGAYNCTSPQTGGDMHSLSSLPGNDPNGLH